MVESGTHDKPVDPRDDWMRRTGPLYPAMVAVRQLTPLPVLRGVEPTGDDLTRAAPWYPAIGGLIGGAIALVGLLILETDMVPAIAGAAVLALAVVAGGALHEGGFARAVEILASDADTDDPYGRRQLGLYGVGAIIALLAVRAVLLLGIDSSEWIAAILISQIVLRWTPIFLLRLGDRLGEPVAGERSLLVAGVSWMGLGLGSGFAVLVAILFGGVGGLLALVLAGAVAFGAGVFYQRRFGGLSGNALAAAAIVCELAVLLVFAAIDPASASPWAS